MIKVVIIGGSGYVGGELLRLLLFHPDVKVMAVTSQSHMGKPVSNIHPNLNNVTSLAFVEEDIETFSQKADVILLALPAGASMERIKKIQIKTCKIIDLGPDFRLKNASVFQKTYGIMHAIPEKLEEAVYGLPEINREKIAQANLVALPGCFPTGAQLALYPLAKEKLLTGQVVIDSVTGSSGSGITPSQTTHHPERADDFRAYQIFSHRHVPEIEQGLESVQGSEVDMVFTPHSAPMVRGIFTTAYVFLEKEMKPEIIKQLFLKAYKQSPFVRIVDNPRCGVVRGTNYCDLAVFVQGKKVIVTTAIDNLVKGAAGQAVQSMNLMFGLDEKTGLEYCGMHP